MKRTICLLATLLTLGISAIAADIKYPASDISPDMLKGANAVVRSDEVTFKIVNQHNALEIGHYAITILSSAGNSHAEWVLGYDKLRKVNSLKATVYDASGRVTKKVKASEFNDQSSFEGMYSDDRAKSIDLTQNTYPYTVEFDYELEYKFLFYIPTMTFIGREKITVEQAKFTLIYPDNLKPRFYPQNVKQSPVEGKSTDGLSQTSWTLTNLPAMEIEPFAPGFSRQVPRILAAPTKFEYEGYVGSMDTWQGYGKWISSLNADRRNLPEATKAKVRDIAAKHKTREEKIRALYNYMQSRTRYVSIQLGIGGQQPFDAAVVDQTGYGDCKALSNYMVTLLNAIDIKSNYVLIMAGPNVPKLVENFPSTQFNHAVVAVPNGADTIWLECTSQTKPFGFAGTFTGNRKALMITDDGASIVKTPSYDEAVNVQLTKAVVDLQGNGNATARVSTKYQGMQYENDGLSFCLNNNYDEQKKWILENTAIPSFDLKSFTMEDHKETIPFANVNTNLVLNRYANVSGKRLFMNPNLMNRWTYLPERVTDRKANVVRTLAYTDIDTIEYTIPENFYPEFLPEPMVHKSRFGEYEASVKLEAGKLIYHRKLIMHRGEYPAETYSELIDFMKSMGRSDNLKMVFLSKT